MHDKNLFRHIADNLNQIWTNLVDTGQTHPVQNKHDQYYMGQVERKCVLRHMPTTKAQISLRIRAV